MLQSRTKWEFRSCQEEAVQRLQEELQLSALTAKILAARGIDDPEQARQWLEPDERLLADPFQLDGMQQAIERIRQAIHTGQSIRIFGDYDCDGVCSTALMYKTLRAAGAKVDFYIPNRFKEGYGLNQAGLDQAVHDGVHLVITVDNGISNWQEVEHGLASGLEIIITDHHEPPERLPVCTAVINPKKRDCPYPFKELCGAGIALKVAHALLGHVPTDVLDLAAIGTVADLVPLSGENRWIVREGLQQLNQTEHVGLRALLTTAGLEDEWVDEHHIGYVLGPRLNACGRLASAHPAVELLLTHNEDEAQRLATYMQGLNEQRQALVQQTTALAEQWVTETYGADVPTALVVSGEDWHEGILGIVASRLTDKFNVPAIVLTLNSETGMAKGSARSIESFNMYEALTACQHVLSQFGGHEMAGGLSLPAVHVEELRALLIRLATEWLGPGKLRRTSRVDIRCSLSEVTVQSIEQLHKLAPFGMEHEKPVIAILGVQLKNGKKVGAEGKHLKCQLEDGQTMLDGIGFGLGDCLSGISVDAEVDLIGELSINEWNGLRKPQLIVRDLRIQHRQFFDCRGHTKMSVPLWEQREHTHDPVICLFRSETTIPTNFGFASAQHTLYFNEHGLTASDISSARLETAVLYDLPRSMEQLQRACEVLAAAQNIYVCFKQHEQHYLAGLPQRDDFRWYYAFLKQKGSFDQHKDGARLEQHKKWSAGVLHFMTTVFAELGFVTVKQQQVVLHASPQKRELHESATYRQKQQEIELEQKLVYSTGVELRKLLTSYLEANVEANVEANNEANNEAKVETNVRSETDAVPNTPVGHDD